MGQEKKKRFKPKVFYPGGSRAMSKFIDGHLKYPREALENKVEGTVRLRLEISYRGKVKSSKIISSLGSGCDEEAQRVVSLLKFKIENIHRKQKVLFHKTLNIRFRLPKPKKSKKKTINYNLVKSRNRQEKKNEGKGYSYTIEF